MNVNLPFRYIVPLFFVVISSALILSVTNRIPLTDEWRWTATLLIPFVDSQITFSQFMLGDYRFLSHSHFLALLVMWFDYSWLGLSFSSYVYIGLLFYVAAYGVLVYYSSQLSSDLFKGRWEVLLILSVAFFTMTSDFPWSLVMFEYVYYFLAISTLIALDTYYRGRLTFGYFLVVACMAIILGDTIGMAAVFTCVAIFFLICLARQHLFKPALLFLTAIFFILLAQYFYLPRYLGDGSSFKSIGLLLANPLDVVFTLLGAFAQPIIEIKLIRQIFGDEQAFFVQMLIGCVGLICVLTAGIAYVLKQGWRISILPMALVTYGLLNWLLILISRYGDYGVDVMDQPRYVRLFTVIYIGAAISLLCIELNPLINKVIRVVSIALLLIFCFTVYCKNIHFGHVRGFFNNAENLIREEHVNIEALSSHVGYCRIESCQKTIEFLREKKLNIFKND